MLNCDVCMLRVVLRPKTEPVDTESDKMGEDQQSAPQLRPQTAALGSSFSFTWHDDEGTLRFHRDQTGTEDTGGVGGGDAAHPAGLLQTFTEGLQVPPAQQNTPVWEKQRVCV